jgi:hypothetical protein
VGYIAAYLLHELQIHAFIHVSGSKDKAAAMQIKINRGLCSVLKPVPKRSDFSKPGINKDFFALCSRFSAQALKRGCNRLQIMKLSSFADGLLSG